MAKKTISIQTKSYSDKTITLACPIFIHPSIEETKRINQFLNTQKKLEIIKEFILLTIHNKPDAQRKEVNLATLPDTLFPFLYIKLIPLQEKSIDITDFLQTSILKTSIIIPPETITYKLEETPIESAKIPIIYDMETSDPDDVLTLLFLLTHPRADLKLVTINPGSPNQVGLIFSILKRYDKEDIPIGGSKISKAKLKKEYVDQWYNKNFQRWTPRCSDGLAGNLLAKYSDDKTTIITGGALTNIAAAIDTSAFQVNKLVSQGGYASASITEGYPQLDKFSGKELCSTYNFNANPKAVNKIQSFEGISQVYFVSKNICHRTLYNEEMKAIIQAKEPLESGVSEIKLILDKYLEAKPEGKAMHDILAAACALTPNIATWKQVEFFNSKGEWGTTLNDTSNIFITVDYEPEKFLDTFVETK